MALLGSTLALAVRAREAHTTVEGTPVSTPPVSATRLYPVLGAAISSPDPQTQQALPPPSIRFERISIAEGLSNSKVDAILQDRQGFLWVGTERGLNRYDGYQFTVYRNDPADPRSLSHDRIYALYEDRAGELWIGTGAGLDRLDRLTGTFVHYQAGLGGNPYTGLPDTGASVFAIQEDRNGVLWVGSSAGLYHLDPGSQAPTRSPAWQPVYKIAENSDGRLWVHDVDRLYLHDPETSQRSPAGLQVQGLRTIYMDARGDVWVGASDGLRRMDHATGSVVHYQHDPDDPNSLSDNRVDALLEDRAGRLWVGTQGGLDLFDPRQKRGAGYQQEQDRFVHYRYDPSDPYSLSDDLVFSLHEDRSGVLWIGTNLGLSKYSWAANRFTLYTRLPAVSPQAMAPDTRRPLEISGLQCLSSERVMAVGEDRKGILWVGMFVGGLNRLDRTAGTLTVYRHGPADPNSLSSDTVREIYEDRSGTLWVGTEMGLNRFEPDSLALGQDSNGTFLKSQGLAQFPREEVWAITEDRAGELWVGTLTDLYSFDREAGRFTPYPRPGWSSAAVRSLYADETGLLWVGSQGRGLYRWDGAQFTSFQPQSSDPRNRAGDFIRSIFTDPAVDSGAVWAGTDASGLLRFDRATPGAEFRRYTEKDGLVGNRVQCIMADADGFLWLATNRGVSRFDPATQTFRNYDARDGLLNGEVAHCFQSSRGEMFLGGFGGLATFYPEQIKDNAQPPPIAITAFRLLNEAEPMVIPLDGRVQLSYQQNDLSFEVAALDYHASGKNQYAYRLEGVNRDWVYAGTRRYTDYTNLSPGQYVFRVKGSNNDGVWNEEGATLYISIKPPFWETWWFRGLVAGLLVASVAWRYRRRTRGIELQRRELERQVQERTAELRRESEQRVRAEEALRKSEMERAVAEERSRLARELHDAVTQTLFSASLIAEVLPQLWQRNRDEASRRLEELRQLNRGALAEMRTLLLELRPAALEKAELPDLLRQLAEALRSRAGLAVAVEADKACALPTDIKVAFYRIAQEALNNVVKHARANQVNVCLRCEAGTVELEVVDDGQGFDPAQVSTEHHGLRIMRERAEAIGAQSQVNSRGVHRYSVSPLRELNAPTHGTQVLVIWNRDSGQRLGSTAKGE